MLRWWDGRRVHTNASSHISLSPGGIVYVWALLREQLPRDTAYVRVGVDDEDRTLHIAPCEENAEGHISLIRKSGNRNSCRVHCKVALDWAGVHAAENTVVQAEYKDGEIVATLPPSLFKSTEIEDIEHAFDKADAKELADAIDDADAVRETRSRRNNRAQTEPEPGDARTKETAVDPRCCTCQWYGKLTGNRMFGTCGNTRCSKYGQSVRADEIHACHPKAKPGGYRSFTDGIAR